MSVCLTSIIYSLHAREISQATNLICSKTDGRQQFRLENCSEQSAKEASPRKRHLAKPNTVLYQKRFRLICIINTSFYKTLRTTTIVLTIEYRGWQQQVKEIHHNRNTYIMGKDYTDFEHSDENEVSNVICIVLVPSRRNSIGCKLKNFASWTFQNGAIQSKRNRTVVVSPLVEETTILP